MEKIKFTLCASELTSSEAPLRSLRRTMIELRLIKLSCETIRRLNGSCMWIIDNRTLLNFYGDQILMIFNLDSYGRIIKDQMIVLEDNTIYRGIAMSESKIYNAVRNISRSEWTPTDMYEIELK